MKAITSLNLRSAVKLEGATALPLEPSKDVEAGGGCFDFLALG
jgi:hypothetical protein